jgi:hypothetical protein
MVVAVGMTGAGVAVGPCAMVLTSDTEDNIAIVTKTSETLIKNERLTICLLLSKNGPLLVIAHPTF